MSLDEKDKVKLDQAAEKLRDLLPEELKRTDEDVMGENDEDPRIYLDYLLRECFSPWATPAILAKKRYWVSIGGVKYMMDYLQAPNLHTRLTAAHACWNFAESLEFQKVQYELGALEEIIKLIQTKNVGTYYRKSLCEAAFGWLWGFLEYDETLDPVNERGVVPVLIESIGDPHMSMTVVVGCVQSCAVHAGCRKSIVEANGIAKLVGVDHIESLALPDVLSAVHHSVITLAHLLNDDRYRQLCIEAKAIEKINNFLENKTIEEVSTIEDSQGFLWQSMTPFYILCESEHKDVFEVGAFCMSYLALRECNVRVMVDQEIPVKLLCLSWMRNKSDRFVNLIRRASNLLVKWTPVPTLKQICYYKLLDTRGPKKLSLKLTECNIVM